MATSTLKKGLFSRIQYLDRLKVDCAIIDGIALGVWAKPRATYDFDYLASITTKNADFFTEKLKRSFVIPQEKPMDVKYITFLRMLTKKDLTVIDLVFADDQYKKNALSGREQDKLDVKEIIEHQRNSLDLRYLKSWLKKMGLERSIDEYLGK